ncbi:hypothetical protein ACFY5J_28695 [Peribacillus butanolivorans]|uniref:hypothetical protein n=1 Tax=Peribacillus butanolivorans TaxID=421767 RepID=UPI00369AD5D3
MVAKPTLKAGENSRTHQWNVIDVESEVVQRMTIQRSLETVIVQKCTITSF